MVAPSLLRPPPRPLTATRRRASATRLYASSTTAADVETAKKTLLTACASPTVDRPSLDAPLATLSSSGTLIDGPYEGEWATLYTDSVGPSAGRVGPLCGEVRQSFKPNGTYQNTVAWPSITLPLLAAKLGGTAARRRPDRVDVVFETTDFFVAGVRVGGRAFPDGSPGSRGHWTLIYKDNDARVFKTNKGSLFVLTRV